MKERMKWKNMKDEVSYSNVWNLFFSKAGMKQILYGKQEDLLKYFCVALGVERGEYRNVTDETNIICLLARISNAEAWYKVICQLADKDDALVLVECVLDGVVSSEIEKTFNDFLEHMNVIEREELNHGE